MTAILGYAHDGKVYMGGDSRAMSGWDCLTMTIPKIACVGDLLIGGSGLFQTVQILQQMAVLPPQEDIDPLRYLVTVVMPEFRRCLDAAKTSMVDGPSDTALLIGYRGVLYLITPMMAVQPLGQPYAIGSGGDFALGAFMALRSLGNGDIRGDIEQALSIAGQISATVGPPYYVEVL